MNQRVQAWERRSGPVLTGLSVAFLVAYAVPILWPELPAAVTSVCNVANIVIWGLFWIDYLSRLVLADHRWRFVRHTLFDAAALLLPMLRALRTLRIIIAVTRLEQQAERLTRGKIGIYVAGTSLLLVLIGGLAVLDAERGGSDANIDSYADGVWWAVATMTTVGYGDHFPTTGEGRAVAIALMVAGIGVLGFVTGSLTTWLIDRIKSVEQASMETQAEVAAVLAEVRALRADLEARASVPARRQPPV